MPFSLLLSIPITVLSVSYGSPVTDKSSSPGLNIPKRTKDSAWVPDTICDLTSAFSALNTDAYIFSIVSLPISPYP